MSYSAAFINYLEVEKRFSAHTLLAYEEDLRQFTQFVSILNTSDWNDVNHQLIRAWIVELIEQGQTNKTVVRKLSCLRSFFKWLKSSGYIELNPMLKVKAPKVEKRNPSFAQQSELDEDKLQNLFPDSTEGIRDRLMFELFYQSGIRLSELLTLRNDAVANDSIKVVGKRNKERLIPISNELVQLILLYQSVKPIGPDSQNLLFVRNNGQKLYPKLVYRKINSYLATVTNLQKKSPHVLRHTFATHMLNNGAGLETLKELLGHANLSATQVYTHNSFTQLNKIYSQAHPRGRKK